MLKPRQILTMVPLAVFCSAGHADLPLTGDICALRPDLCDEKPRKPLGRQQTPNRNKPAKQQIQRAPASSSASNLQRPAATYRPTAGSKPGAGAHRYPPVATRQPTSSTPTGEAAHPMTFDEYMTFNANNPAMHAKIPDHQTAFIDTSKQAVFGDTSSEQKVLDSAINGANPNNVGPLPQPGFAGAPANPFGGAPANGFTGFGAPSTGGWPAPGPQQGYGGAAPAPAALPAPVAAPVTGGGPAPASDGGPIR